MSPTDTQDDRDAALNRNQARYEAREQAADDRCSDRARYEEGAERLGRAQWMCASRDNPFKKGTGSYYAWERGRSSKP